MALRLIKSSDDLVTSHDATRSGFLEQALRKTEKAAPYIAQARRLATIMLLQPTLDENYRRAKAIAYAWPGPASRGEPNVGL